MERIIGVEAAPEVSGASVLSGQGAFANAGKRAVRGFCIEGVVVAAVPARAGGAHDGVLVWITPQAEVFGRQERGAGSCAPTRGEEIIASLVCWAVDLGVSADVAVGDGVGAGVVGAGAAAAAGLQDMFPSFGPISALKKGRASASQGASQGAANDGQGSLFAPRVMIGATSAADGDTAGDTAGDRPGDEVDVAPEAIADVIAARRAALTRRVMREGLAVFFPGLPPIAAPHSGDGVIVEVTAPDVMERLLEAAPCAFADLESDLESVRRHDPETDADHDRRASCAGSEGPGGSRSSARAGARDFCRAAPVAARFIFLARSAEGDC